jgi:hypothetical protein
VNDVKLTTIANWAAVPLTVIGLLISIAGIAKGAGHGTFWPALVFFPLPTLTFSISFILATLLALLQFPLYAVALNVAEKHDWHRGLACLLGVIHIAVPLLLLR